MTARQEIDRHLTRFALMDITNVKQEEILNTIISEFEKLISATEEEVKKHICDDEDSLIDYGVGELADKLREELEK